MLQGQTYTDLSGLSRSSGSKLLPVEAGPRGDDGALLYWQPVSHPVTTAALPPSPERACRRAIAAGHQLSPHALAWSLREVGRPGQGGAHLSVCPRALGIPLTPTSLPRRGVRGTARDFLENGEEQLFSVSAEPHGTL